MPHGMGRCQTGRWWSSAGALGFALAVCRGIGWEVGKVGWVEQGAYAATSAAKAAMVAMVNFIVGVCRLSFQ